MRRIREEQQRDRQVLDDMRLANTKFFILAYIAIFVGNFFVLAGCSRVISAKSREVYAEMQGPENFATSSVHLQAAFILTAWVELVTVTWYACRQKNGVNSREKYSKTRGKISCILSLVIFCSATWTLITYFEFHSFMTTKKLTDGSEIKAPAFVKMSWCNIIAAYLYSIINPLHVAFRMVSRENRNNTDDFRRAAYDQSL